MNKIKKLLNTFTSILLISAFLIFIGLGAFFISSIKNISTKEVEQIITPKYSLIVDENNRTIEDFRKNSISYVEYKDIPQILIDALISIEDKDFYVHNGINEKRIFSSFINNINPSNNRQGGSTLTQQLVKNILLTNEKSYKRKVQEAYIALKLEKLMTKEEILEQYFNRIYFDQSVPGIQYASYKFFNKDVSSLNLVEASTLAGLVKSPSYYYPISYPERTYRRKNEVLDAMLKNNKITSNQHKLASSFTIEDILHTDKQSTSYNHQAYLDVVYKEVKELTGLDIFSYPVKIETYIDTYLQNYLDEIQNDTVITINNPNQQFGGVVLNKDSHIIGVLGGRKYEGKKIFNHAYDMKTNPASTMKPIFSYALGVEHLNLNTLSTLKDEEYYYPNSSIKVNNADKSYLGNITLLDALGYSRNTCAVATLEKVVNKIGLDNVISHLKKLNLMDEGPFTYSYAIGGMKYGVTPINIAGAYSMLANNGLYSKPTTIKRIIDLETNEIIYQNSNNKEQIISEESADIITNTLERIVDNNYLSMKQAKPNSITVAGKTGTGAYSKSIIDKYHLPSNADKDIWFSGYSKNYTCTIWSGFDKFIENEKTYFSGKEGKNIPKDLFKLIIQKIEKKHQEFEISSSLTKVYVVTNLDKQYIQNELVPNKYISFAYYKKEDIPSTILPYPTFNTLSNINCVLYEKSLCFSILDVKVENDIYSTFYGDKGYVVNIYINDELYQTSFYSDTYFEITLNDPGLYKFEICESYKDNYKLKGEPYSFTYFLT